MNRIIEIAARLWELAVIRYVLITGKGRRSREWRRYVRSEAAKKAWVTRKQNIADRKYAEFLDRVHVTPEELKAIRLESGDTISGIMADEGQDELRDCA